MTPLTDPMTDPVTGPVTQNFTLETSPDDAGQRLDRVLAAKLADLSRSRIQALIASGQLMIDGSPATSASQKLKAGQRLSLNIPPPVDPIPRGQDIPLDIVYEDEHLIIINKPAGLVVHPAPGSPESTLVNALIHHCGASLSGIGGVRRPGIVHRIDKDTSGLMVVAKDDQAHAGLADQFARHDLDRVYNAIVWGAPTPLVGRVEGDIGRHPTNRQKMAIVKSGGKHAVTHYRTLKRFGAADSPVASLVECKLETGRTHQIRVHMTSLGHPLLGDAIYGRPTRHGRGLTPEQKNTLQSFPRQALHATVIGFIHPVTGNPLKFEAGYPSDILELLGTLESL
jgi:23S rRNA pseudouridine1911/1915/1917 synthase